MAVTEAVRLDLYDYFQGTMGRERATNLMELLPPVGWGDVATKQDLEQVRTDLGKDIAQVRTDLGNEILLVRKDLDHLRTDMGKGTEQVRTDFGNEIALLRADMSHGFDSIRKRMTADVADIKAEMYRVLAAQSIGLVMLLAAVVGAMRVMH